MNRPKLLYRIACMVLLCFFATAGSQLVAQQKKSNALELKFRQSQISVDHNEVAISDVMEVRGGTQKLRSLAGKQDLEVLENLQTEKITKQQVAVRLLVAGFDQDDFIISGDESTYVKFIRQDDLKQRIESKIESELARQFGVSIADVQVNLSPKTDFAQIGNSIDVSKFDLMAIFPSKLPLGDKTIQTEFIDRLGERITKRLNVQIVVMKEMVVTSEIVARGTVITADHVQTVKRPMANDNNIELASLDCIGCTAVRDIPPYEIVSTRYLTRQAPKKQVVIRQNSLVDILLSKGRISIRMRNAKALKSGAVGDTIPVLNLDSNKQINAVVRDQSTVVVRY